MSDEGANGAKGGVAGGLEAARRAKRAAPAIELTAVSSAAASASAGVAETVSNAAADAIDAAAPAAPPAARPDPAPAAPAAEARVSPERRPSPPLPPPPGKSGGAGGIVAGAVAGLVAGIVAAFAVFFFRQPPDPAPRLVAIEARVTEAGRAAAAPLAAIGRDIETLKSSVAEAKASAARDIGERSQATDGRLATLDAAIKAVSERLDGLSVPSAAGGPAIDIGPLSRRVEELASGTRQIAERIAQAETVASGAAGGAREAVDGLKAALERLAGAEEALKAAAATAAVAADQAKEALATARSVPQALAPELGGLAGRVADLAKRQEAAAAAPVLASVQALAAAARRGQPFAAELAALEALRVPAERLADLRTLAATGVPTPAGLLARFQPVASQIAASGGQPASSAMAVLSRFVSVRPVGEPGGNDPAALVARIEAALKRGDLAGAMASWTQLPEAGRTLATAFAGQLADADRAAKALRQLEADAVEALRRSAP
jgi:hypothetical protein